MVEPVSLAATAVSLLVPLLARLGGRVAEEGSEALAEAAVPIVKRLYERVKAKLLPSSYGGSQLDGVEERPDSEGRRQALRTALAEELEADPAFAAEVAALVSEAEAAGGVQVIAQDAGVVAGRDVHQRGRYVAGRDMKIGDTGHEQR